MGQFIKRNIVTIAILGATLVLAGIAVFTAIRLYQLRQQPVAPTAPESKPGAQAAPACQALTFTLTQASPTPTPSGTPGATPTPTPTATPTTPPGTPNSCGGTCGSDANCQSGMICYITSGTSGVCRNPSCVTSTNCVCGTSTPIAQATPTPTSVPTTRVATPAPQLPQAGVSTPTILGIGLGTILLLGALILAL